MAALAAGMLYNVQVFDAENGSDISMAALGVMAVAQNEGGSNFNGICCQRVSKICRHPLGPVFADAVWVDGKSSCS